MEDLPLLFQQSPEIQQINLEFSEINSLEPLLPLLSKFTDLKELLLFGNRLESLPLDLSCLTSLEKLDISNNLIEDVRIVLPSLKTLPRLTDLQISTQLPNEENLIVTALPGLLFLNGCEVTSGSFRQEHSEEASAEEIELEEEREMNCFKLVDSQNLSKTFSLCENYFSESSYLSKEYVEKIAVLYDEIRDVWKSEHPEADQNLAEFFEQGVKKIIIELSALIRSEESETAKVVQTLKSRYLLALICVQKLVGFLSIKHKPASICFSKVHGILEDLFSELLGVSLSQRSFSEEELGQRDKEEPIQSVQEEKSRQLDKEELIRRFQEERAEFLEEIQMLKEENEKYLDIIIRHSKESAEKASEFDVKKSRARPKLKGKLLTIRQLKEVIDEIYLSKARYDEKCFFNKMPRETMEQHINNYLNTKYGLKSLTQDWSSSIYTSINKHYKKDNDIEVFRTILKNECEEEFRLVQTQVKETIQEVLKLHLRSKNPLRNAGEIQQMIQERVASFLFAEEWQDILKNMYNEEDFSLLSERVLLEINRKSHLNLLPSPKGKISREESIVLKEREKLIRSRVLFQDFLKVLLDFQLETHQNFLKNFTQVFQKFDKDADGVLTESQFRSLVQHVNLGFSKGDVQRLLQLVDPYDNKLITFSQCITLFSAEQVPIEGIPVIKRLSLAD